MRESRKLQLIILMVLVCLVGTMSIAYAILSTTLQINGQAEISSASWDIYLDNVELNSRSVTSNVPVITDKTTATFSTTLSKPGDFYEFTIDVINNGAIDAMIDGVTKTPTLATEQSKYLNYIVEYQNGESITTKQLVAKKSFVRLKVKVEFRKDITASDLPTQSETLSLSFKVNYVQSDENSENITIDNNGKLVKVVSGNYDTVGSEICIGNECFYVISSDEDSVTMLAKYNLYVGGRYENTNWQKYGEEATGIQNSSMLGYITEQPARNGTIAFASSPFWSNTVSSYPAYVYGNSSFVYEYVERYREYLESQGVNIVEARLISYDELYELGCRGVSCADTSPWVHSTSYWTGSAYNNSFMYAVYSKGSFTNDSLSTVSVYGVRPVIKVSKTFF